MKHGAGYIVKRLAPMIGRPTSTRRIAVEHRAYTLADALEAARGPAQRRQTLETMRARDGDQHGWITSKIRELERTATWIERRGAPSTRRGVWVA